MQQIRKVIDGKIYDTKTADVICEIADRSSGDFTDEETSLFRTKKGAFFVAGEGEAGSQWRQRVETHSWGSGFGMRLITEPEARILVEQYADEETFTRVFGQPEEG